MVHVRERVRSAAAMKPVALAMDEIDRLTPSGNLVAGSPRSGCRWRRAR